MTTTQTGRTGDFCWINMLTPQPADARTFFATLLGWSYDEIPGVGHTIKANGRVFGGLFDVVSRQTPRGTPPIIGVMVKVENADAACARIVALGGKAKPAFDIGPHGRMAVCHDPNGAAFDVWESKPHRSADVDLDELGAPNWFENITTDAPRATQFYLALFGWVARPVRGDRGGYIDFDLGGTPVAGLMPMTTRTPESKPYWATYFAVRDVAETQRLAEQLGAKIIVPAHEIPGVGWSCSLISPQGVPFAVMTWSA